MPRDRPFCLYFTPCAPPTHVTPAAKFRGTSEAGIYGDYIQELDAHVGEIPDRLDELCNLATDPAETMDLAAKQPERVKTMSELLEKTIAAGRSTPGAPKKNDVAVRRYPSVGAKKGKDTAE